MTGGFARRRAVALPKGASSGGGGQARGPVGTFRADDGARGEVGMSCGLEGIPGWDEGRPERPGIDGCEGTGSFAVRPLKDAPTTGSLGGAPWAGAL